MSILAVLKGVTIGDNSIVGACSAVTKNILANEIWTGNPAIFIRKITTRDAAFKQEDGGA